MVFVGCKSTKARSEIVPIAYVLAPSVSHIQYIINTYSASAVSSCRVHTPITHNYKLFHRQDQLSHKSETETSVTTFDFLSNWLGKIKNRHRKLHKGINGEFRTLILL